MINFKKTRRSFLTRTAMAVAGAAITTFKPVATFAESTGRKIRQKATFKCDIRDRIDPDFAMLYEKGSSFLGGGNNKDLIVMGWADPFYPDPSVPPHVLKATTKALETWGAHYTLPIGLLELRQAIARKMWDFNGIKADPEKEIIVTPGSDTGLYYAIRPFITPGTGQEILNPEPSYPNNFTDARLVGAKSISVPLKEDEGFQLNIKEFEKRISERTKMVVLTHPNNPTTTVYTRENLEAFSRFVIEHDLLVVVDQAFEHTVFDDREYVSLATLPGMKNRTITVCSISKSMGLAGFRVAYIVACEDIMRVLYGGAVNILGATNTAAQYGAIAALADHAFIQDYNRVHDARRKLAFKLLNEIAGVHCQLPESGFMAWVNVSALGSSKEVARYLADDAKVLVGAGNSYGSSGADYLRIVLGVLKNQMEFEDALQGIVNSLHKLSRQKGL